MKVIFAVCQKGEMFKEAERTYSADLDVLPVAGSFVQHPAEKQVYQVSTVMFVLRTEHTIMGHADAEVVVFLEKYAKMP